MAALCLWLLAAGSLPVAAATNPAFPLKAGENHRHLADQRGVPFLYHADTPWMMFTKLTEAEVKAYIARRKEQGFTALQVQLTGFLGMTNRAGELPFAGKPPEQDFARPNEKFFSHVDRVVAEGHRQGMLLAIASAWAGCCGEGWAGKEQDGSLKPLNQNGAEKSLEPGLIARAQGSWWWNEAPSRFDIPGIRAGAQRARDAHCTGFIPSLECYSYVQTHEEFGEPCLKGRRQVPFGFGWLAEGVSPYRELPMRAARLAYREYTANPDLSDAALQAVLGRELFGPEWQPAQVEDTLELCRVFGTDRDWSVPAPLTTPGLVESRRKSGRLDAKKRAFLRDQLARVRAIAARHRDAKTAGGRELARIAQWLTDPWQGANTAFLEG
jgi:hypothetical protein